MSFLRKFLLLCFIIVGSNLLFAQGKGSIIGKVLDKNTNEELIGASVLIEGTQTGMLTDIEGSFYLRNINSGQYNLRISYISYKTLTIENVVVKEGESTQLKIALESTTTELDEVVITAEALKNSEASILRVQQNAINIVDGMSAELISKGNSSDGTDVMKKMTGVTISEGKYVFIRGVGDRYNNTLLNGANLPSTDPEKKSFSYDLFPASLIENLITAKTFSPDKPADFSGGLVQINTIDFPSEFILDVGFSSSSNSGTTFKNVIESQGGGQDFLGQDDGTRQIPTLINGNQVNRGNFTSSELVNIGLSFKNNWATKNSIAPLNTGFKFSLGNKINVTEDSFLGYIASFTYNNSFESKEFEKSNYSFEGLRYHYKGNSYSHSVSLGGMFNISYKFGQTNKISLKNIYNQNADDETAMYAGDNTSYLQFRDVTSLRYISRNLLSNQILGEHQFSLLSGLNFNWGLSFSKSERDEPDARRYVYARDMLEVADPLRFLLDQSTVTRYFGKLVDNNLGVLLNFNLKPFENPDLPSFKFGFAYDKKERDFNARTFGFRNMPGGNFFNEDSILTLGIDRIFQPENFTSNFIEVSEVTKPSDSYLSNQTVTAAYLMFDSRVVEKLRVSAGVRFERSNQNMNTKSLTGETISISPVYNDFLPALNLTYILNDEINLRFAYSQTLARPEFRELAPFSYFDYVANELVVGNDSLKRSLIQNVDLRFELFPGSSELVAISLFYKSFQNPIEQVIVASASLEPIRSFANANTANNFGIEFEVRKNLAFVNPSLKYFSFVGNASWIESKLKLSEKSNDFQRNERALQGQANYIINTALYYDNFELGFSAGLQYNQVGEKIAKVGYAGLGDIIELPRDVIDFSVSQKLFGALTLKLTARDILAQDYKFVQRTSEGDKVTDLDRKGRGFSASISYEL